ncbi:uncharacterized protein LOC128548728 [Mercenaria mercenaria]|uniref:uncharacterized protein LOC128548728 n=1 Tax=Mercenaria mercenaria TaxID=6596 RepID=UPI00234F73FB|nr:uncharacterized protein LOC128548728 [Mercenaria mercenaria]
MPLRPIVSSVGSIMYNSAKYLAKVMSPLVGKTNHHIKNSKHFAGIKDKTVNEDEIFVSNDVSALFTSVPVGKTLTVIKDKLSTDTTLSQRTPLSADRVTRLLELCLKCTYFVYDGQYYLQIHGAAMGSPVSPIVCNLYTEHFESLALSTAPTLRVGGSVLWTTLIPSKQLRQYVNEFTDHINSIDPDIKFTIEKEDNGTLAFLDTNTVRLIDGHLKTTVFRKPTHTDQYLDFNSAHPEEHKLGVIRTLHQRAEVVTSDPTDLKAEIKHVNKALNVYNYPRWAVNKVKKHLLKRKDQSRRKTSDRKDSKGSVT